MHQGFRLLVGVLCVVSVAGCSLLKRKHKDAGAEVNAVDDPAEDTATVDPVEPVEPTPPVATHAGSGSTGTKGTGRGNGGGGGGGSHAVAAANAPCPGPGITRRCGGRCVNLQTDDNNCGSCGTVCSGGKHCDGHLFCRDAQGNL